MNSSYPTLNFIKDLCIELEELIPKKQLKKAKLSFRKASEILDLVQPILQI